MDTITHSIAQAGQSHRTDTLYRAKVSDLANALTDPEIRTPALEIIRSLIDRVTVRVSEDDQVCLELDGAVCAMIEAAQPRGLDGIDSSSVKVVAGVGFEPTTFRL